MPSLSYNSPGEISPRFYSRHINLHNEGKIGAISKQQMSAAVVSNVSIEPTHPIPLPSSRCHYALCFPACCGILSTTNILYSQVLGMR